MPRLDAFRIAGIELWFNSADHKPPHFHAEKTGVWEVRVYFLRDGTEMVELVWGGQPRAGDLKKLRALAEEHRPELLLEWEQKVVVSDPGAER
ncbi:MAG: DUF4160 domain-containing protein [Gemmatimonadaceae bacterium]